MYVLLFVLSTTNVNSISTSMEKIEFSTAKMCNDAKEKIDNEATDSGFRYDKKFSVCVKVQQ